MAKQTNTGRHLIRLTPIGAKLAETIAYARGLKGNMTLSIEQLLIEEAERRSIPVPVTSAVQEDVAPL